jgi:diguanylate cyclase (GGDEF)-like protein
MMTQQRPRQPGPASAGHKPSLLVVGEQPDVRPEVAALVARDFAVQTADGVVSALRALAARDFDLLLADQALQPLTGVQLLGWARRRSPRIVGVLLAGCEEAEQVGEAIGRGEVYDCLLKPLRAEALLQTLRRAARPPLGERCRALLRENLRRLRLRFHEWAHLRVRRLERAAGRLTRQAEELEEVNRQLRRHALDLERLALTDPLTLLPNRRAIEAVAEYEVGRRARYPGPLALGLIDVDHFKRVNTRHLWQGGDEVLKGLARALAASLRAADRVGRVGGEEFLVCAPQTDKAGARALAERIRATVESTPILYNNHSVLATVSIGFAVAAAGEAADLARLRQVADDALKEAKRAGRNRSIVRAVHSSPKQGRRGSAEDHGPAG